MKPSDLKAGTTYVGKNGRRRYVCAIWLSGHRYHEADVKYAVPEGGEYVCSKSTFARWAEREATPEDATEHANG